MYTSDTQQIRNSSKIEHMQPQFARVTGLSVVNFEGFGAVQALRGYALILTHPGVPCVFHWDYARRLRKLLVQSETGRMDRIDNCSFPSPVFCKLQKSR